jgi:hypothetical protein
MIIVHLITIKCIKSKRFFIEPLYFFSNENNKQEIDAIGDNHIASAGDVYEKMLDRTSKKSKQSFSIIKNNGRTWLDLTDDSFE